MALKARSSFVFIEIPDWVYRFILVYFILFKLIKPVLLILLNVSVEGVFVFTVLGIIYSLLLYAPILFFRNQVGFFHPLVFPLLFSILKGLIESRGIGLFTGFIDTDFVFSTSSAFRGQFILSIENLHIQSSLFDIAGIVSFYIGYLALGNTFKGNFNIPAVSLTRIPLQPLTIAKWATVLSLGLVLVFFVSQGGLTNYLSSWGTSRKEATEQFGIVISILNRAYVFPLLWFIAYRGSLRNDPLLIATIALSLLVGYFTSGSRSSIVTSLFPFFMAWIVIHRRIPLTGPLLAGSGFFLIFGVLGKLRASVFDGEVDWDVLTDVSIESTIQSSASEATVWANLNADLAIYRNVPEYTPFMYGEPYLGAVFFFIPRAIWPEKPHGTGYYVGRRIFGRSQAGVPPGEVGDVYYNFGVIGIFIMFFLKGIFYRVLVNRVSRQGLADDVFFFIAYLMFLQSFSLTVLAIVQYIQFFFFIVLVKSLIGRIDLTKMVYPMFNQAGQATEKKSLAT